MRGGASNSIAHLAIDGDHVVSLNRSMIMNSMGVH